MVAIITMFFLFAMIAFVTNLAAPLGTIWKNHYSWAGMLGNMMNFLAYLFMGIPAGNLLTKIGYKKTALLAMVIGIVGLILQVDGAGGGVGVVLHHGGVVLGGGGEVILGAVHHHVAGSLRRGRDGVSCGESRAGGKRRASFPSRAA